MVVGQTRRRDDSGMGTGWVHPSIREILVERDHDSAVRLRPLKDCAIRRATHSDVIDVPYLPGWFPAPQKFTELWRDVLVNQNV